ncbi:Eco57I restriction-modification methylase domain-containing protein [Treponema succinifaciens]|uniref:Eco57I restriction-modification methylase domain-containing protein n=1 Tax=Treponema succinifaciens TaxID=167 RepID=UPI0023F46657|nr:Eco57I restriction-modification methylase domain-containing protein [Treponema succinifaciens]
MAQIFNQAFEQKLIYVYRINDTAHEGILKIGEASCNAGMAYFAFEPNCKELNAAAKDRIRHQTQTAGVTFELLYTEATAYMKGKNLIVFQDHDIHDILVRSGIKRKIFDTEHKANEWFYTDLETVKKAIAAAKEGRTSLNASEITKDRSPVIFRPEQTEAIEKTIKQFKKSGDSHQMLWNAKMRFGKTLSTLEVVKRMNYNRTLILTHRPVVDSGWFEDYGKIFYDRNDFYYFSKKNGGDPTEEENFHEMIHKADDNGMKDFHFIYFASIQDMRGSELVGGKFAKNEEIFNINWDLIIIDEAHEGTQTELGKAVLSKCRKENTRVLHLSGTPFNLMDDFKEDEIYTWDYVMEQRAKAEWDKIHQGDPNPYSVLPKLSIYTYNLGKLYPEYADADIAFNFREFFRVDKEGDFIHETNVKQFLDLLTKEDTDSNYPYSTEEYRQNFRHSLWMIPGVKEAKALSKLLQEHPVFSQFAIANVAGDGDEEEEEKEALKKVEKAIGPNPEDSYSITLSCGRLTTGVSVKPWTACFMLSGSFNTAASTYMQTIFRVQTPAVIGGKQKEECFVFDFAPDRTLKVIAETAKISSKAGKTTNNDREILGEFLNFCPIIGFEGSQMKAYNTEKMLGQLKKAYIERVVKNGFEDSYLYNDELLHMDKLALEEFSKLKEIIGSTKAQGSTGDININAQGLTDEQYELLQMPEIREKPVRELTPKQQEALAREKEIKKNRDTAISILRGISIRMPLLMYGADLQKNLDGTEEAITLDNFCDLVDDLSWEEFMPKGVTKEIFGQFKKYYDSDVFRESGVKIREMARAADKLSIEDRIERISSIFATFRNPDKETVLTPWRVVNMHLAQSLGGWCFYDKDYNEQILEPELIKQNEITDEVFKKNTHILEINSKSGLYALYCAYSVYRTRSKLELGPKPTREMEIDLWKKVLAENIFLICKTPMAKKIAQRTLAGFTGTKVNAHYFEDLVNQLKNKPENFISKVSKTNYWKKDGNEDMKFDAIVGNPPYQIMATGNANGSDPIYHLFIDAACKLGEKVSFIHPARFLFNAGKTPKDWNEKMLNDEHYKVVQYWANSGDVFPTVDIKGGVAVTYWDKNKAFEKIGTFVAYDELRTILEKVKAKDFAMFSELVYGRDLYRLTDKLYEENPWAENRQSKGHKYDIGSNVFDTFPELFYEEKPNDDYDYAKIFGREKNNRILKWIKKSYVKVPDNFDSYKIFIPKANGTGAIGEVLSTPIVGEPIVGEPIVGSTTTFLSVGKFNTQDEAENCMKYIKTKFARAMLGTLKVTQDNPRETWLNVPLQDFTTNSDIDWSQSIPEIDKQLYKKYGLSAEEIAFIESKVKSME